MAINVPSFASPYQLSDYGQQPDIRALVAALQQGQQAGGVPSEQPTESAGYTGPDASAIEYQKTLAKALREKAGKSIDPMRMAGGYVLPISPLEGLAKLGQNYFASQAEKKALEQEKGYKDARTAALLGLQQKFEGGSTLGQAAADSGYSQFDTEGAIPMLGIKNEADRRAKLEEIRLTAEVKKRLGTDDPSAVREYLFYQSLPPEQKRQFLDVKRQPNILNLGGTFGVVDPTTRQVTEQFNKTLAPENLPETRGAQSAAVEQAKIDVEKTANQPKASARLDSLENSTKNLVDVIDTAKNQVGNFTTGLVGSVTRGVPGTTAFDLAKNIDTIKANIGFDELQEMRDNSPTGGALGQVAVQEIVYLQASIRNLEQSQSKEQFLKNLEKVRQDKIASNQRIKKAYEQTYGQQSVAPAANDLESRLNKYRKPK